MDGVTGGQESACVSEDPAGELTVPPHHLTGLRGPTSKGRGKERKGYEMGAISKGKGKGGNERGERREEREEK